MFGDRIFSFLVLSMVGTGVTFSSPDPSFAESPRATPAIAQAQEAPEENPSGNNNQLKPGDEGDIVTELQDRLKQLGHYEGDPTGKYDEKTQEAVAKFQTSQKLEPTGIFDEASFDKLRELQNIPTPRRQRTPKKRPWSRKKKLVIFGGGGLFLLVGMGGTIFFLLRYINQAGYERDGLEEDEIEAGEEEREIKLTELYPMAKPASQRKIFVKADESESIDERDRFKDESESIDERDRFKDESESIDERDRFKDESESIDERDRFKTDTFPPPFPTPPPQTWPESPSPSLTQNINLAPEFPPNDRPHLTKSLAIEPPHGHPNLIKSQQDPIEELIRELHSPDPEKRKKAIWELAQRADSRAVQPLVSLLLESDSQQQSLILEALSQIGTRTLKPMNRALALSLQDDNAQVRKNAIRDLTRVYELIAQLSQLIYYATDDPDPEVQETAKWALGQLSHIRMLPSDRNHE